MILNSPYITGSLTVTGNATIQGALIVTGSLSGTASFALNSDLLQGTGSTGFTTTASFNAVSSSQQQISASLLTLTASYTALSSSYTALSGSYTTFSGSASTRITVDSASLQQVSSSQQQISSSYIALSASYNTFSGSASTRVSQIETVYATTGSNSFRANQSITGSLVVSSTITAQTLIVQTVTSSIVFSSGSNIFGNQLANTQTFTGSVNITGSLALAGNITSNGTAVVLGSGTTNYLPKFTALSTIGDSAITDNGTTVTLNSRALSGTSATFSSSVTATSLQINGGTTASFVSATQSNSTFPFGSTTGKRIASINSNSGDGNGLQFGYDDTDLTGVIASSTNVNGAGLDFYTYNGSSWGSRMRITKSGNVGIGTTNPTYLLDVNGTGRFSGALSGTSASFSSSVQIVGGYTAVQPLQIGRVSVMAQDVNSFYIGSNFGNGTSGNYIISQFANQIHFDSALGNINLKVAPTGTAGNAISYITALTIASTGNVGIGGVSSPGATLTVANATAGTPSIPSLGNINGYTTAFFSNTSTAYGLLMGSLYNGNTWMQVGRIDGTATAYNLLLQPNGGNLLIGTTSDLGQKLQVTSLAGYVASFIGGAYGLKFYCGSTYNVIESSYGTQMGWLNTSFYIETGTTPTQRFNISSTGAVTISSLAGSSTRTVTADASGILSTSSDSSLKQEDTSHKIEGLAEILQLQPRAYKWLSDIEIRGEEATTEIGFFANEVNSIIPSAAPKCNDGLYGFYDRAVIAALTKAIQEQHAQIQNLQEQINILAK